MRVGWLVVLAFATTALLGGATVSASTPACATSGPLVCVTVTGTPDIVWPSTADSPRYVAYSAEVTNNASSTVTHATAKVELSGGLAVVSATSGAGSCTTATAAATCTLGNLASGSDVTITVVARAPETEGSAGALVTVSFDERANDGPTSDPKQDTVSAGAATTVLGLAGKSASFVPEGMSVELTTDPTDTGTATLADPLIANAHITASLASVTALIEEVAAPVSCPKRVTCMGGDWLRANIPGTFDPPLSFDFRWDNSLVPSGLNAKKLSVLYTQCLAGCPVDVVSDRCSSPSPPASELPCLTGIKRLSDGDWVGTLVNRHNGFMHG